MIEFFFVIGLTLFIGFAATLLFDRTRISQVLILMLFGFLLGPGSAMILGAENAIIDASNDSIIISISTFIATLALIILLFDGGMTLDIFRVVKALPKSTLFTFVTFIITLALIASFAVFVLGWNWLYGLLLGAVLGGISSAIVIAIAAKSGISDEAKAMLTIESSITDALCIIAAIVVIELIITANIEAGTIGHMILGSFVIALFIGAISAVLWIAITNKMKIEQYGYMLTLAMVFFVYAFTEGVQSSGGFAVFTFGLVLGNAKALARKLRLNAESIVSPHVRIFQEEVTFFVRTFFFVYIGILVSPSYFTPYVIAVGIAITVVTIIARMFGERIAFRDCLEKDRNIVTYMVPRGLAAAVLATLPPLYGIYIPEFQPIIFGVIILTNVAATGGVFFFGGPKPLWSKLTKPKPKEKTEGDKKNGKVGNKKQNGDKKQQTNGKKKSNSKNKKTN